ncbi:uncharacterized protein LOC144440903 [Glandiceps talaboti]
MSRLSVFCIAMVALCALLTVADSRIIKSKALIEKLSAAKRNNVDKATHDIDDLKNMVKSRIAAGNTAKKTVLNTKTHLKKDDVGQAAATATATGVLGGVMGDGNKRGLKAFRHNGKTSPKKSYEEVFYVDEFITDVVEGYMIAPCNVGMLAFEDIMANMDWEAINWAEITEEHVDTGALAFIEWWSENKCSEFFASEYTFYHYIWSIFWDDLEETPCGKNLPRDPDNTISWKQAFEKVNSLDPTAWENAPEPQTECEEFEYIGEVFFDFFFIYYFDAMPDYLLEDMFNDYGVNDYIDPYFGYTHFSESKGN